MNRLNGGRPSRRYDLSPLEFVIVPHLAERWVKRIQEPYDRERVKQEVFDAIFNGRWSRNKPSWLGTHPGRHDGAYVYAWPPDFGYAYVVRFADNRSANFLVRTVLLPVVPHERSWRAGLLRWLGEQAE